MIDIVAQRDLVQRLARPLHGATFGFPLVGGWEAMGSAISRSPSGSGDLRIAFHQLQKPASLVSPMNSGLACLRRREDDEARQQFEHAAGRSYLTLLWRERRQLFIQRTFLGARSRAAARHRRGVAGDRKNPRGRASRRGPHCRGRSEVRGLNLGPARGNAFDEMNVLSTRDQFAGEQAFRKSSISRSRLRRTTCISAPCFRRSASITGLRSAL